MKKNTLYNIVCTLLTCIATYTTAVDITQADIDQGFTITQPGMYTLVESVVFSNEAAITIMSDDVVLDLNDNTLDGADVGVTAINITSSENVYVKNGVIKNNTGTAIAITNSSYANFFNIKIEKTLGDGLSIDSSAYNYLENVLVCYGQQKGIVINDSTGVVCKQIKILACLDGGIEITGVSNNSLCDACMVTECTGTGFMISSDAIELVSCASHMNKGEFGHGFVLQASNCFIQSTAACKNEGHGIIMYGDTMTINCMTVSESGGHGLLLESTSAHVTLTHVFCAGNAGDGVRNLGATNNTSRFGIARNNGGLNWYNIVNKNY